MSTFKFKNADNFPDNVPDGAYAFEVVGVECGIQSGTGKTNGSPNRDLKLHLFDEELNKVGEIKKARLILHESIWWKVCTFLKSANYLRNGHPLTENDDIDCDRDLGVAQLMGLRGWCEVKSKAGTTNPNVKFCEVEKWLTDRPKISKAETKPATQGTKWD